MGRGRQQLNGHREAGRGGLIGMGVLILTVLLAILVFAPKRESVRGPRPAPTHTVKVSPSPSPSSSPNATRTTR